MPLVCTCHEIDTLTHNGLEEDHLRLAVLVACKLECVKDALVVMTVSNDHIPSECTPLLAEVLKSGNRSGRS